MSAPKKHGARVFAPAPRLWPGETFVCLGSGPSLTAEDVDVCRGRSRVIAVNDTHRLAPWAEVLYAADAKWWRWFAEAQGEFAGLKYTIASSFGECGSCATPLQNTGPSGLETSPTGLRTGRNSGYQAINLAVHLGARRIVLLGYDMRGDHFFGSHRDKTRPPFAQCIPLFKTLVQPLAQLGIEIVNCSRSTAIDAFSQKPLAEVLS